jgi:uncharacterized small protein (DUF1192 family)
MEVTMSLTPNARRRQAFLFGRQAALRSTSDVVDQLQQELHAEREQHAFDVAELEKKIAMLLRDLARARYELAQRDMIDAFANAPSPSAMMH